MSGPIAFPCGPGQTPDNLTGLPAGQAKVLGQIGVSNVPLYDVIITPLFITLASATTGVIEVYLALSENGGAAGNWTDSIDPTSSADQSAKIATARLVRSLQVSGSGTTYRDDWWSVVGVLSDMPMFLTLIVWNKTGAAFASPYTGSNFIAEYTQKNYSTPLPIFYS